MRWWSVPIHIFRTFSSLQQFFCEPPDDLGPDASLVVKSLALAHRCEGSPHWGHSWSVPADVKRIPHVRQTSVGMVGPSGQFTRRLFPDGDQGGNRIPTEQRKNLHSLWDGFPGSPRFSTCRNRAIHLLEDLQMRELGERAGANQDVKAWLNESHQLAITVAYDAEVTDFVRRFEQSGQGTDLPRLSLSEGYLKQGGAVASRCLVEAGYRLGKMLEAVP